MTQAPSSDAWAALDEITLQGMRFHVLVGILPHERTLPQPLEADLTVWITAGEDVLDYRGLYDIVRAVVHAGDLQYLELIADRIAIRVLANPLARRVRVALRKPHVALPGPVGYAEVVVLRTSGA